MWRAYPLPHQPNWLLVAGLALGPLFGLVSCAINAPPTRVEIHEQTGALGKFPLDQPWIAASLASDPVLDNWLASFDDPQLNALITEALINNPDLRVTATRVEQAGQYVEMAKAALRPTINLFGTGGINMGGGDISSALQGASVGVSWEPDLWGRLRYGHNAAESTFIAVQADYEFSRQSLAAMVARGWFTATETWLQLQLAQNMVSSAEELQALAEKRWEVGVGSEQEATLSRATVGNFRDALRQVQLSHTQSLRGLELLLGRYPAAELQARQDLTEMPGPIPAGLPLQMLERRPDMIAAEQRVAAAFSRVGEAKAAKLPRIILNANVASISSEILQLRDDFDNPTGGAGAKLLAPLYRGGELQAQVEIRTLEQKEAMANYARLAMRALADVENSLAISEALADRHALLEQILADKQRAMDLAQTSYRVGRSDLRSVQQQQINLHAAHQALLRVQSDQLSERTRLHLALGGSFEPLGETPSSGPVAQNWLHF